METQEATQVESGRTRYAADLSAREQRRDKVMALMLAHTPYRQIAEILGVSLNTVGQDVKLIRKRWVANSLRAYSQHVAEQDALLDGIERAMAPKALKGDTKAAEVLLRVMERRARLLGLDRPVKVEAKVEHTTTLDQAIEGLLEQFEGQPASSG